MIARMWRGRTRAEDEGAYVEYMNRTGVRQQRGTPGNTASMIFTRKLGDEVEYLVLSLWDSPEAVRAFAGERPEIAVYFPDDTKFLLELEPEVLHYEVPIAEFA